MKLDCVLTAVNENPLYFDFIPIWINTWKKLYPTVDVKIILIAKTLPDHLQIYSKYIILFEPLENISTSFTSQFIRNLYPCILNYENGVMITDIDNIPMNRTFFTNNIENISENKWINLRDWFWHDPPHNMIAMCWQVATPKIWKEVFNINSIQDIKDSIINMNSKINYVEGGTDYASGWNTDQLFLYQKVMEWNKKTNNYIFLKDKDTKWNRLDRGRFHVNKNEIINGKYSDYHMLRPMSEYYKINYEIFNLL